MRLFMNNKKFKTILLFIIALVIIILLGLTMYIKISKMNLNDRLNKENTNEDISNKEIKELAKEKKEFWLDCDEDLYKNNAFDNLEEKYDCNKCINKIGEYDAYDTILESTQTGFKLAPFNYDGDVAYHKEYIDTVECTKEVEFYCIDIKNTENVDEKEYIHECSFNSINKEEVIEGLEYSSVSAFIWFDEDKRIEKMVLYGSTTISE